MSLRSALIVAGGQVRNSDYSNAVEIFKAEEGQWYRTKSLPVHVFNMSMAVLQDTCYVVGGYRDESLCQVYSASITDLLSNAIPATQEACGDESQSVWTMLPSTPNSQPAAVALAGKLLTIAGGSVPTNKEQSAVYVYSPSSGTWDHVGDLPAAREICTAIAVSPLEILVIGGRARNDDKNTVFLGRLQLFP